MKKRILSFLLAGTMLAGMTASAADLYLAQKFDYPDVASLIADTGTYSFGTVNDTTTETLLTAAEETGKRIFAMSSSAGRISADRSEIWTAPNGVKLLGPQRLNGDHGAVIYMLDRTWNIWDHQDEIFVVSFDAVSEGVENDTTSLPGYNYVALKTKTDAGDGTYTSGDLNIACLYKNAKTDAKDSYFSYGFHTKFAHNTGVVQISFEPNQIYRVAQGLFCKSDATDAATAIPVRRNTLDAVKVHNDNAENYGAGKKDIVALRMHTNKNLKFSYGNIRIYAIDKDLANFKPVITEGEVLPETTKKVTVKFDRPIAPATYNKANVTVTANGEAMEAGSYTVSDLREVIAGTEIYSEVDVFFDNLEASTEYAITFPATISDEMLGTLSATTATFATPDPDIKINGFDIIKGFTTADEEVVENFVADGSLQVAKLAVENTTTAAKNVAVIYAVYGANGKLNDVVYANNEVEALSETNVMAGTTLSAAGTVKAFVWDGISSLKPHAEATVKTIAAAE